MFVTKITPEQPFNISGIPSENATVIIIPDSLRQSETDGKPATETRADEAYASVIGRLADAYLMSKNYTSGTLAAVVQLRREPTAEEIAAAGIQDDGAGTMFEAVGGASEVHYCTEEAAATMQDGIPLAVNLLMGLPLFQFIAENAGNVKQD